MAAKYYAVRKGNKPGIYRSWDECKKMVHGFSGAEYKSFATEEEANAFMTAGNVNQGFSNKAALAKEVLNTETSNSVMEKRPYAFVDGSFNQQTGVYGYGGFLVHDDKKELLSGSGSDSDMASMRNVAGEVLGSRAAVQKAVELGLKELDIYYDYMGIEMWALGLWKRNKKGTIEYFDYIQSVKDKIELHFVKVKGHSGVEGNEEADRLAKKAVGIIS